jgi:hypothetical protein
MAGCCEHGNEVGYEVLTAVRTKMAAFWVVAPCSLVEVYQRFRGPCCLHHQGDGNEPSSSVKFLDCLSDCQLFKND